MPTLTIINHHTSLYFSLASASSSLPVFLPPSLYISFSLSISVSMSLWLSPSRFSNGKCSSMCFSSYMKVIFAPSPPADDAPTTLCVYNIVMFSVWYYRSINLNYTVRPGEPSIFPYIYPRSSKAGMRIRHFFHGSGSGLAGKIFRIRIRIWPEIEMKK